jgi:hypothetical protein
MGGVDKHDKLWTTFALGKSHKFKKFYVKLLLFFMLEACLIEIAACKESL